MDTLSHGLYGGIAVGRRSKKEYLYAFLFGVAPDILAFGPLFLLSFLGIVSFERTAGKPDIDAIPAFVFMIYDMTHSLVVFATLFGLLWLVGKWWLARLSLGWPLHILVDIPTHDLAFFPTPFLWPLSNAHFDGIPWSTPWIFIPNVLLIAVLYLWWWFDTRARRVK